MILLLARAGDTAASALSAGWLGTDACIIRVSDLSASGWCHFLPSDRSRAAIAVGGQVIPESSITGVLTRIEGVSPYELPHIVEVDRSYVAAEMSAFLLSWLHALDCPVVNRPMPGCLAGPPWRAPQWAAAVGLTVAAPLAEPTRGETTVTVVGAQCFGEATPTLRVSSLRLARLAQVGLLSVRFDGDLFVSADAFPSLADPEVAEAVLDLLRQPTQRPAGLPDLRPWRNRSAAVRSTRRSADLTGPQNR